MKPGVTNHLGDEKSLEKDSFLFFSVVYPLVTHNWLHYVLR